MAHAVLTPQNAAEETERVLRDCLRLSGPGYLLIPNDLTLMAVVDSTAASVAALPSLSFEATSARACASVPAELEAAVSDVLARLRSARRVVVIPTVLATRHGADGACRRLF